MRLARLEIERVQYVQGMLASHEVIRPWCFYFYAKDGAMLAAVQVTQFLRHPITTIMDIRKHVADYERNGVHQE